MHLANPAKLTASSLKGLLGKTLKWAILKWAIESNNESEPSEFQNRVLQEL